MLRSPDRARVVRRTLFFTLLCAWISSPAFTYIMMKDGDLLDQTPLVVVGQVIGDGHAVAGDHTHTYYRVEVADTLKGAPSGLLQVRVAGSPPGANPFWRVAGAPHFVADEAVLLFLGPQRKGARGLQQFALGAFHIVQLGVQRFAVRDLGGGNSVGPGSNLDPPRLLAPFSRWLKGRAQGELRTADYFANPADTQNLPHPDFTQFTDSSTGNPLRWRAFDSGTAVNWLRNGGDAYVTQINQALAAWQNDPGSTILLSLGGTTTATGGLTNFDSINTLLFGDPNQEIPGAFSCSSGGTLATGGPWFNTPNPTHTFNGTTYQEIVGGDVIVQDGVACAFDQSGKAPAAEVIAHEIGHTLGLEHSCGDSAAGPCDNNPVGDNNALMRASTHGGSRGATLGVDDQNAIAFIYGSGGGGNQPPTAAITANCTNLSCNFSGASSSDPDGSISSYAWTFGDGQSANGVSASHTYANAGAFAVSLTVTDNQGAQDSASGSVTVFEANLPPSAVPTVSCNNLVCSFDATASIDPDGTIVSYLWRFGDGQSATGATVSHSYAAAGSFIVSLTVTDNQGSQTSFSLNLTVSQANTPPVAGYAFNCSHRTCTFNASPSNDSDGTIASYQWSFGDSTTGTGVAPIHTFAVVKTYSVSLTVTDNAGAQDSIVHPVPAGTPFSPAISGLWFDPSLNGEGYNLISSPSGQVLFYYGHDRIGGRMWLISETLARSFLPGDPVTFTLFKGAGGTFDSPAPSSTGLSAWGTMTVTLDSCTDGSIVLDGQDGQKTSSMTHLAAIAGADCVTPPVTTKATTTGLSGLWFDPSLDGEGYNVIQSPSGMVIFYYGYSVGGGRVWLLSDTFTGDVVLGQPVSLTLFRAKPGDFDTPNPELSVWGSIDVVFNDCTSGVIALNGPGNVNKTSNVILLAGIGGVTCVAR